MPIATTLIPVSDSPHALLSGLPQYGRWQKQARYVRQHVCAAAERIDAMGAEPRIRTQVDNKPNSNHMSRWLVVVMAVCGALAGASIVEAFTVVIFRPNMPISPGSLVAPSLIALGALAGGMLSGLIAAKDRPSSIQAQVAVDSAPTSPMSWQPTPTMLPIGHASSYSHAAYRADSGRAAHIHRTLRRNRSVTHRVRITATHAHALRSRHLAS